MSDTRKENKVPTIALFIVSVICQLLAFVQVMGVLLPSMISAKDTLSVYLGFGVLLVYVPTGFWLAVITVRKSSEVFTPKL